MIFLFIFGPIFTYLLVASFLHRPRFTRAGLLYAEFVDLIEDKETAYYQKQDSATWKGTNRGLWADIGESMRWKNFRLNALEPESDFWINSTRSYYVKEAVRYRLKARAFIQSWLWPLFPVYLFAKYAIIAPCVYLTHAVIGLKPEEKPFEKGQSLRAKQREIELVQRKRVEDLQFQINKIIIEENLDPENLLGLRSNKRKALA